MRKLYKQPTKLYKEPKKESPKAKNSLCLNLIV